MNHLATYNVFRENDGSLWVTVAGARGVQEELGMVSGAVPLHVMAMRVLDEAVRQTHKREADRLIIIDGPAGSEGDTP